MTKKDVKAAGGKRRRTQKRAVITGMKCWGGAGSGYANEFENTVSCTVKLMASNTDPATNSWSGTQLWVSSPFNNLWNAQAQTALGIANSTRYRYVWWECSFSPATRQSYVYEVEFYETLGGVESKINPAGKTIISRNFSSGLSNPFDGDFGTSATNVLNGNAGGPWPVCSIGLDLGV